MAWLSWAVLVCNVGGAVMVLKYGLPAVIPLLGRDDADMLGMVGLALFGFSIAARISSIIMFGS